MEEGYTTERLLVAVARKEHDAFRRLYRQTAPKLFAITLRLCRDRALAADALQETYIAVWRRAAAFNVRKGTGLTWLAIIARNRAAEVLRRSASDKQNQTGSYQKDILRIPDLDDARLEYKELDTLMRCLDDLDAQQRQALLLAYYDGCSREELSRRLDIPVSSIKTRLRSAFATLRHCPKWNAVCLPCIPSSSEHIFNPCLSFR